MSGGSARCSPSLLVACTASQNHPCSGMSGGRSHSRQAHHRSVPKTTSLDTLDCSEVRTTRNLFQKLTTTGVEGHLGVLLSDPPDVADIFTTERWPEPPILLGGLGDICWGPTILSSWKFFAVFLFHCGKKCRNCGTGRRDGASQWNAGSSRAALTLRGAHPCCVPVLKALQRQVWT